MAAKPTKLTQAGQTPVSTLNTAAPLPANIDADGRSPNLYGTTGPFVVGGVRGYGMPLVDMPNAASTLTADQLIGGFVSVGAGANLYTTDTAVNIVKYVTQQYAPLPTVAWPNTGTVATALVTYPTFLFTLFMVGTSTLAMGAGCLYHAVGGTGAGAANTGALTANTVNTYHITITNATPGSEAVKFIRAN